MQIGDLAYTIIKCITKSIAIYANSKLKHNPRDSSYISCFQSNSLGKDNTKL